ncbi:MAG: hypothetical protein ABI193_15720 [Minicystis sp.]
MNRVLVADPILHTSKRRPLAAFLTLVTLALLLTSSSGCVGIINNTPELRWKLFSLFGASKICPEMLKRSVAIRLQDRGPSIGRFFPMQCTYSVDDARQVVTVSMAGTGYGYMLPAKRVGFSLTAAVEYRPDFVIAGDDLYVWAKLNRIVDGPRFQLGFVENPLADVAANIPPFGSIANFFGNQVVTSAMTQGFTVIHNVDKGDDFTLGLIFPPVRPNHPFQVTMSERFTFANETIGVQGGQRDYLGPFEVSSQNQALYLTLSSQGPAVDVMLVDKLTGDTWRDMYQRGMPLGPSPGPVLAASVHQPGAVSNLRYPLPPGLYYVVIDNTAAAGSVAPVGSIWNPLNGTLAEINYVAQLAN